MTPDQQAQLASLTSDVATIKKSLASQQQLTLPLDPQTVQIIKNTAGSSGGGGGDMLAATYDPANIAQQVVGTTASQTLTNKTISVTTNTITNIGNLSLTSSSITIGSTPVSLGATATTISGLTLTQPTLTANLPTTPISTASSGTVNFNMASGNVQFFEFNGSSSGDSVTFTLSNVGAAQIFIISVTQNSGGSGTVTWFGTIRWAGGVPPTLSTTPGARDTFGFMCPPSTSGLYDGFVIGQNI